MSGCLKNGVCDTPVKCHVQAYRLYGFPQVCISTTTFQPFFGDYERNCKGGCWCNKQWGGGGGTYFEIFIFGVGVVNWDGWKIFRKRCEF